VPDAFDGWVNTGFVTDVSADGRILVGYGAGPRRFQGFIVALPRAGCEVKRSLPLLVLLSASPAFAQRFDVALVAGYTTPAGIEQKAAGISDLELAGSFTWGASLGWNFHAAIRAGGLVGSPAERARHQHAVTAAPSCSTSPSTSSTAASYGSWVANSPARVRSCPPGAGAARFSAPQLQPETKLSFNVGGGLKWMPTPRAGARLQVRYTPIRLDDSQSDYCDPFGFCQGWFHQLELTGGVVVRF
jgi:hypothetical protein